jgi:predicted ATPase
MGLLRTESGVVVQGPPGTGKTHTIANLMSALLARGQRVLVTSQKDQALRVLRDKIPAELRQLCVLLAGGSRDASAELGQGLSSLSEAVATSDRAALRRKAEAYAAERGQLRSQAAVLNGQIRDLREAESKHHDPVAPWYDEEAYAGSLGDIVREVKRLEAVHGWFPPPGTETFTGSPPLTTAELQWLRQLLISDSPGRRARVGQWIPRPGQVMGSGEFDRLVRAERAAEASARAADTPLSRQLATLGHVSSLLLTLGIDEFGQPISGQEWTARAINDLFIEQNEGLWNTLFAHRDAASRIDSEIWVKEAVHVVEVKNPMQDNLGAESAVVFTTTSTWRSVATSAAISAIDGAGSVRHSYLTRRNRSYSGPTSPMTSWTGSPANGLRLQYDGWVADASTTVAPNRSVSCRRADKIGMSSRSGRA